MLPAHVLSLLHKNSMRNETMVRKSCVVGCFGCISVLPASWVNDWVREKPTPNQQKAHPAKNMHHTEQHNISAPQKTVPAPRTARCPLCQNDTIVDEHSLANALSIPPTDMPVHPNTWQRVLSDLHQQYCLVTFEDKVVGANVCFYIPSGLSSGI